MRTEIVGYLYDGKRCIKHNREAADQIGAYFGPKPEQTFIPHARVTVVGASPVWLPERFDPEYLGFYMDLLYDNVHASVRSAVRETWLSAPRDKTALVLHLSDHYVSSVRRNPSQDLADARRVLENIIEDLESRSISEEGFEEYRAAVARSNEALEKIQENVLDQCVYHLAVDMDIYGVPIELIDGSDCVTSVTAEDLARVLLPQPKVFAILVNEFFDIAIKDRVRDAAEYVYSLQMKRLGR